MAAAASVTSIIFIVVAVSASTFTVTALALAGIARSHTDQVLVGIALALIAIAFFGLRALPASSVGPLSRWVIDGVRAGLVGDIAFFAIRMLAGLVVANGPGISGPRWGTTAQANIVFLLLMAMGDVTTLQELIDQGSSNRRRHAIDLDLDILVANLRRRLLIEIELISNYLAHGLAESQLSSGYGPPKIDEWLSREYQERGQRVRNWAHPILLATDVMSLQEVSAEIVRAIPIAIEGRWAALPKSGIEPEEQVPKRLARFLRAASVGVAPIVAITALPVIGIPVAGPIHDAVLAFGIPWLLVQAIEIIAPGGSDALSKATSLRDLLVGRMNHPPSG